jgi:hypothetical protein
MIAERRVLPLEGGLMTTLAVRAREQAIERRFTGLAGAGGRDVGERARTAAGDQVAERIDGRLSDEQARALRVITGPERGAILVGPAGTGLCRFRHKPVYAVWRVMPSSWFAALLVAGESRLVLSGCSA